MNYQSFEAQGTMYDGWETVLCVLIYRPPRYNKDFIQEFSEFYHIMPVCDNISILGDFNAHMCCMDKPIVSSFFLQVVNGCYFIVQ